MDCGSESHTYSEKGNVSYVLSRLGVDANNVWGGLRASFLGLAAASSGLLAAGSPC